MGVHSIRVPRGGTVIVRVDESADPILDFGHALLGIYASDVTAEQVAGFLSARLTKTIWEIE